MPASPETRKRKRAEVEDLRERLERAEAEEQDEVNDHQRNAAADGDVPSSSTSTAVKVNAMLQPYTVPNSRRIKPEWKLHVTDLKVW